MPRIRIDQAPFGFDQSGELFDSNHFALGSGEVPFLMNLGAGAQAYDFCFDNNGIVEFVAQGGACGTSPATGNFIAPFSAALTIGGNTQWGTGFLDKTNAGTAGDPFNLDDATTKAIRFVWEGQDTANNDISTELLLWEVGSGLGNFSFEFRYGNGFIDTLPATGQQAFHLGDSTFGPVNGPFSFETDYNFSFVNGACTSTSCTTTPPTPLPEPSTIGLLILALGLLALFSGRTRLRRLLGHRA